MRLPYLNAVKSKADMANRFLGYYNHPAADPSQFTEMTNLSGDLFPVFSPRRQRRLVRVLEDGRAIRGGAELSWVADGHLYYDGEPVAEVTSAEPQLVRMGAYLIVWPDRIIYNTHTQQLVAMDATVESRSVIVRPCTLEGAAYPYASGPVPPADPQEQSYWWNTDTEGMYQYLGGSWEGIDTVYTRIEIGGMEDTYHDYDVVSLQGFSYDWLNAEGATVYKAAEDWIVIATGTVIDYVETNPVTITRQAPEMDFICESGNRLWGCSSAHHEVYGSKLGDPTNWRCYLGISTDSYAATVGSAGDFTGIALYMGYVHFFKENCVHRLYGTQPSNFQLVELPVRGVKAGCHRSLCTVNQILYYVSRDGLMAYDGSAPVDMGGALGEVTLDSCVCGTHVHKLYLSALVTDKGGSGQRPVLYVMDQDKGLWHIEDDLRAVGFAETPEGDFVLDDAGQVWLIDGGSSRYETDDAEDEGAISWSGVTGDVFMEQPGHSWIKKITFRLGMERGARLSIDIEYDSSGRWERAMTIETEVKKSMSLPIRTRRCDHFRLRYTGTGDVRIYSISKTYDMGSERATQVYRR